MKNTPIGYSVFKTLIEENRFYVDKTALVSCIVKGSQISLLCRPRRFGKSLNLSMLRYFFDKSQDYGYLFEGLAVQKDAETMKHQGQYPVIMLSFKDVRPNVKREALYDLCKVLYTECVRHNYLKDDSNYVELIKELKDSIKTRNPDLDLFVGSIRTLSELLKNHFSTPVVVLIDEYDTPVQGAWLYGYFDEMVGFMRKLLGSTLKDNPHLTKGVLTGILRVAKESLFSDLNNFTASSGILQDQYSDKFGFTEAEVQEMLHHYGLNGREMADLRSWYDGYRFGNTVIYNPWSIVYYIYSEDRELRPYWVNTSGNELLRKLFFGKKANVSQYLEELMNGKKINIELSEHLVFNEIEKNDLAVLNMLYFSGYLRAENPKAIGESFFYDLSIPNREVLKAYKDTVIAWLKVDLEDEIKEPMLRALITGDVLTFEEYLSDFVVRVFSFYDADTRKPENFYHAFLLGLLVRLDFTYRIRSNVESGFGRYDICLIPKDVTKKGIIMELKSPNLRRDETLANALTEAENQMARNKYDTELKSLGVTDILRLAIAVSGKDLKVKEAKE
jgi:Predicted AAA-ATPase/PD-(D/E)XK nuclease superfamily